MELPTYFSDFMSRIRPTSEQRKKMKKEHRRLRDLLHDDEELGPLIVSTFIQGSYRRLTGTRPIGSGQCDVDVIAVTNMHEEDYTPKQALEKFRAFLKKHYPDQYKLQGRSWGISVGNEITLDLVPTSAPSEAQRQAMEWTKAAAWDFPEEPEAGFPQAYSKLLFESDEHLLERFMKAAAEAKWKQEPLRIPDRVAELWDDTHPLEQIRWTWAKSKSTNAHYVNVVKAIKRWRQVKKPAPKYPRSYPLEHMIGDCCPDEIGSIALGVTRSFEIMEQCYRPCVNSGQKPHLTDRGVPAHDVLERVTVEDFKAFLDHVKEAAGLSRRALDAETVKESARLWRELFGDEFPAPPDDKDDDDEKGSGGSGSGSAGYTPREKKTVIGGGRFA